MMGLRPYLNAPCGTPRQWYSRWAQVRTSSNELVIASVSWWSSPMLPHVTPAGQAMLEVHDVCLYV